MLTPSAKSGYTLVELLIAMTIGFVLFAWMSDYMTRVLADHTTTLQRNLLNQEFQTTTGIIKRELGRAGFWAEASTSLKNGPTNPFGIPPYRVNVGNKGGEVANSCITYSYDLNRNGLLDLANPDEGFGFRLSLGAVEMRTGGGPPLDCNNGVWTGLTSPAVVIDTLTFSLANSDCINLSRSGADCLTTPPVSGDLLARQFRVDVTMSEHLKRKPVILRSDTLSRRVRNVLVERMP